MKKQKDIAIAPARNIIPHSSFLIPPSFFTLVELLVVIGIFMLVASISTVAVAPMLSGRGIRSGAATVQTALRQARSHAAHSQKNVTVRFEYGKDHDPARQIAEGLIEIVTADPGKRVWACPAHPDTTYTEFGVCEESVNGGQCGRDMVMTGGRLFEPRYLPAGVEFVEKPEITFTPMGALHGVTGTVKINIRDTARGQRMNRCEITVIGASGLVRVGEIEEAED